MHFWVRIRPNAYKITANKVDDVTDIYALCSGNLCRVWLLWTTDTGERMCHVITMRSSAVMLNLFTLPASPGSSTTITLTNILRARAAWGSIWVVVVVIVVDLVGWPNWLHSTLAAISIRRRLRRSARGRYDYHEGILNGRRQDSRQSVSIEWVSDHLLMRTLCHLLSW